MSTLSQFYGFGQVIPSTYIPIDYLVIGGGGSGGGNRGTSVAGGGGGAGAYINGTGFIVVPGTTYTVTVGAGGVYDNQANQGGDGGFSRLGNIYAWGGGGGGGAFIDAKKCSRFYRWKWSKISIKHWIYYLPRKTECNISI